MKFSGPAAFGTAAIFAVFQACPAPVVVANAIIAGALSAEVSSIAGAAISGNIGKREAMSGTLLAMQKRDYFDTLPQPAGSLCRDQLSGVTVNFTPLGEGSFKMDNVPSACMTLSTVLINNDDGSNGAVPTPLGSASLQYTGVSTDDMNALQSTLDSAS